MDFRPFLFALAFALIGSAAEARMSIDCTRTQDWAEIGVCKDRALAAMDDILFSLYQGAVTQRPKDKTLPALWGEFAQDRSLCQLSEPCIRRRYDEMMTRLVRVLGAEEGISGEVGFWVVQDDNVTLQQRKTFGNPGKYQALPPGYPVILHANSSQWWSATSMLTGFKGYLYVGSNSPARLRFVKYTPEGTDPLRLDPAPKDQGKACVAPDQLAAVESRLAAANGRIAKLMADNAARTATASDGPRCDDLAAQLQAANAALAAQGDAAREAEAALQADMATNHVDKAAYDAKVQEIAALNAAIADLTARTEAGTVPRAEFDAQAAKLAAANQALADLNARIAAEFVPAAEFAQKTDQVEALNASLADLKATMARDYVERAAYEGDVSALQQQVAALNASLSEQKAAAEAEISRLNALIESDYIARDTYATDVARLTEQVAALNATLAQQKADAAKALSDQTGALNNTIVDMQTRTDTLKRRLSEVQTALSSFIDECKANPDCAAAMGL